MQKLILFLILICTSQVKALALDSFFEKYKEAQLEIVSDSNIQFHKVPVAILDISFFGYKLLLTDNLSSDLQPIESSLISPHGTGVAQVLLNSLLPEVRKQIEFSYFGLIGWDVSLETHLQNIFVRGIRLVNISYFLKNKTDIKTLNKYIDKGLMIVVSAGNSAERNGVEVPEHYQDFKGLIASSLNKKGDLAGFSHSCSQCLHVPGDVNQYNTQYLNHTQFNKKKGEPELLDIDNGSVTKIKAQFGMTSSASPMLASALAVTLMLYPSVNMTYLKQLLLESSANGKALNKVNIKQYFQSLKLHE